MRKLSVLVILCLLKLTSQQHRVPPGVPPQQYAQHGQMQPQHGQMQPQHVQHQQVPVQHVQHQVPVQQVPVQQQVPMHQQVPVQHQQVPVQHQQVPVQQMQQVPQQQQFAVPQHQVPVQQVPQHPGGHGQQQLLNVANMAHEDKEHLKEHLNVPIDTSNMSEQELQFHYFKMHDADNNNKLDGCELIKSLIHWHEQGHHHDPAAAQLPPEQRGSKLFTDQELVSLIDPILSMDDINRDGFIDYPEFVQAQHKAAATQQTHA